MPYLMQPPPSAMIKSADAQTQPKEEGVQMRPRHGDSPPTAHQRKEVSQPVQFPWLQVPRLSTDEVNPRLFRLIGPIPRFQRQPSAVACAALNRVAPCKDWDGIPCLRNLTRFTSLCFEGANNI